MYSPRIREDLLVMLKDIQQTTHQPLAVLVDELLRPEVLKLHGQLTFPPPDYTVEPYPLMVHDQTPQKVQITGPQSVWELCRDMGELKQERVDVLLLNTKNFVEHRQVVFLGTLNSSLMHPREVYAPAIKRRASNLVMVYNHPSSDPTPSSEDIRASQVIQDAGKLVDIPLLDHVIIGGDRFYSLKERGHL